MKCAPFWGLVLRNFVVWHHIAGSSAALLRSVKASGDDGDVEEPANPRQVAAANAMYRATRSYADRAKAAEVETVTAEHQIKAHHGAAEVEANANKVTALATEMEHLPTQAEGLLAKTKALSDAAVSASEAGRTLAKQVRAKAYAAARVAAEAKVEALEKAADKYYEELLDQLAALANPPRDKKAEAAAAAGKPYFDVEMRTMTLVMTYSLKAQELINVAKATVALAHNLAKSANYHQSQGYSEMAQRLMIQAHGAMGTAQLKEDQAKKLFAWARALNERIPSFQLAAQQAAGHVLATFAGLQVDKRSEPLHTIVNAVKDHQKKLTDNAEKNI